MNLPDVEEIDQPAPEGNQHPRKLREMQSRDKSLGHRKAEHIQVSGCCHYAQAGPWGQPG